MCSYFSSRERCGVVKVPSESRMKDIYLVPIAMTDPVPAWMASSSLPGAGIPEARTTDMLLMIFVAVVGGDDKRKRSGNHSSHPARKEKRPRKDKDKHHHSRPSPLSKPPASPKPSSKAAVDAP